MPDVPFGIKVALPGGSVNETDDKKLAFNSGLNTFKFVAIKVFRNITFPSFVDINTIEPIKYAHGLPYIPSYIVYTVGPVDGILRNPDQAKTGTAADKQYIYISASNNDFSPAQPYEAIILLVGADDLDNPDS